MTLVDKIQVFETDTFKLCMHEDGFAELLFKDKSLFDVKDILEAKQIITTVLPNKKIFYLVEAEGDFYTTKEARELVASPDHNKHHGAIAMCTDKLAHKILGNVYIKINKPNVPTRIFNNRKQATIWLRSLM